MLTEKDIEKILRLEEKGFSISKLSRITGHDRKTIREVLKRYGRYTEKVPRPSLEPQSPMKVIPAAHHFHRSINQETMRGVKPEIGGKKVTRTFKEKPGTKEYRRQLEKTFWDENPEPHSVHYQLEEEPEALRAKEMGIQSERQAALKRNEEAEREAEEERRRQRHRWIEGWKNWAINSCIPYGLSVPASIRFEIKDKIEQLLRNRSEEENRWEIQQLVEETTNILLQPLVREQEQKRRAEEQKRKQEEAERKRMQKTELIKNELREVDRYISANNLDSYVREETRKKIREQLFNHLFETLPEEVSFIYSWDVQKFLDVAFKGIKEKVEQIERKKKEAEERERQEREKEERIQNLINYGKSCYSSYCIQFRKKLGRIDLEEDNNARRFLEEELTNEIEGDETERGVEEIAFDILHHFFFEDSDNDEESESYWK